MEKELNTYLQFNEIIRIHNRQPYSGQTFCLMQCSAKRRPAGASAQSSPSSSWRESATSAGGVDLKKTSEASYTGADEYPRSSSASARNCRYDSSCADKLSDLLLSTPHPAMQFKRNDPGILSTTMPKTLSS